MTDFYTLWTDAGLVNLGNATINDPFNIITAVVGDGNGSIVTPVSTQTALVNQVWSGAISGKTQAADGTTIVFEFVIPVSDGPFTIREVGLVDDNGDLVVVGNWPETEKPVASGGATRDMVFRLPLHFENAETVSLVIDPNVALVSTATVQGLAAVWDAHITGHANPDSSDPDMKHVTDADVAVWRDHIDRELDPTDGDTVKEKHLSNAQAKVWQDHLTVHANPDSSDDQMKHVTDADVKVWQDHVEEGSIHIFAGMEVNLSYVPPAGEMASLRMLERNGASLLRADYPALYAKIGVMYGAIDGTHFNLPDDRGLFARVWDHGAGVDPGAAVTVGGIITAGSPVITSIDTAQIEVGMYVVGTGIPAGATVVSIDTAEAVTISVDALVTGSPQLIFTNRADRGDGTVGDYVGTAQDDGFEQHAHSIGGEVLGGTDGTGYDARVNGVGDVYSTSAAGGVETRAKNRAKWGGIFY